MTQKTDVTSFELCKFERIAHSHLKDAHTYHVCPILLCGRAIFFHLVPIYVNICVCDFISEGAL